MSGQGQTRPGDATKLYVWWCPVCEIQTFMPWHFIEGRRMSEGAEAQHQSVKIEVVPASERG